MDERCKKYWYPGMSCRPQQALPIPVEGAALGVLAIQPPTDTAGPGTIVFGAERSQVIAPIPGFNAPALPMRPVREPELSLIALSGIDPAEPVMVDVPPVFNTSTFTASRALVGRRIGYADRYVRDGQFEPAEHRAVLRQAFDILRQAGAQLVAVDAQRVDDSLKFSLCNLNEIDELVSGHGLDALVSDELSAAFHAACTSGYPKASEVLEDGTRLWFYSARWSRDLLTTLVRAYRQSCQEQLQGALNSPTA